jgi:RHS repeat-associated protein
MHLQPVWHADLRRHHDDARSATTGQYTNSDTGLIYMRARTYDPASAQFLTVDPAASIARARGEAPKASSRGPKARRVRRRRANLATRVIRTLSSKREKSETNGSRMIAHRPRRVIKVF